MRRTRAAAFSLTVLAVLLIPGCVTTTMEVERGGADALASAPDVVRPGVRLETDLGVVTFILYPEAAPLTVDLLTDLVAAGFYDGLLWHRVVDDFVIQTGDASGTGQFGTARTVPLEVRDGYHFAAGTVGIARDLDSDSGSSQFFITEYPQPHLHAPRSDATGVYGRFTVAGQVVLGMDVVRAIAAVPTLPAADRPMTDVRIRSATLVDVTLGAREAAPFPLATSAKVDAGDWRVTLERPSDRVFREGRNVTVAVYVQGPGREGAMALSFRADGEEVASWPLAAHGNDSGVRAASGVLARAGALKVVLVHEGRDVVAFDVRVGVRDVSP